MKHKCKRLQSMELLATSALSCSSRSLTEANSAPKPAASWFSTDKDLSARESACWVKISSRDETICAKKIVTSSAQQLIHQAHFVCSNFVQILLSFTKFVRDAHHVLKNLSIEKKECSYSRFGENRDISSYRSHSTIEIRSKSGPKGFYCMGRSIYFTGDLM